MCYVIVVFTDHTHLFLFSNTIVQIQSSKLPIHTGTHCRSKFALLHED